MGSVGIFLEDSDIGVGILSVVRVLLYSNPSCVLASPSSLPSKVTFLGFSKKKKYGNRNQMIDPKPSSTCHHSLSCYVG